MVIIVLIMLMLPMKHFKVLVADYADAVEDAGNADNDTVADAGNADADNEAFKVAAGRHLFDRRVARPRFGRRASCSQVGETECQ